MFAGMSLAEIVRQFWPTLLSSCLIVIPQIVVFIVLFLRLLFKQNKPNAPAPQCGVAGIIYTEESKVLLTAKLTFPTSTLQIVKKLISTTSTITAVHPA